MKSTLTKFRWQIAICSVIFAGISFAHPRPAFADQIPSGWEASNFKPIGYSDLGGHEAFKMAIKHVGDRWYLYMGHFVANGWSIVDVTDPTDPKVVKFLPGPTPTSAGQIDRSLPNRGSGSPRPRVCRTTFPGFLGDSAHGTDSNL